MSLYEFDHCYTKWKKGLHDFYASGAFHDELMHAQRDLIEKLSNLSSVYPVGHLHDCSSDEKKRPIVLGAQ